MFDLHATASAVSALSPREISVDVLGNERQARDDPVDDRSDARSVRFACRHPPKLRHPERSLTHGDRVRVIASAK
jgi:hypothetical protein